MSANPFEHKHPHYDDAEQAAIEAMDPAQKSLTDALRVSFGVLKVVMAVLVIFYLSSGFFTVRQNEVAVRLTFGQIVGATPEEQILPRGRIYAGWPFPITQVVRVNLEERFVDVATSFWPADAQRPGNQLNPERDGALLTAETGLVHARFRVNYRLGMGQDMAGDGSVRIDPQRCIDYITNFGDREKVERLIHHAAEQAMIELAATLDSNALLLADTRRAAVGDRTIRDLIQDALDKVGAGVLITGVDITERRLPGGVQDAQQQANEAITQRGETVNDARRAANEMLASAAGGAYQSLLHMVDRLDLLDIELERGVSEDVAATQAERDLLDHALDTALRTLTVPDLTRRAPEQTPLDLIEQWLEEHAAIARGDGDVNPAAMTTPVLPISGRVADTIQTAHAQASSIKRSVQSEARTFEAFHDRYGDRQQTVLAIYTHQAVSELFDPERIMPTIFLSDGRPYLEMNLDPRIIERMQRRQREQQEQQRQERERRQEREQR